LNLSMARRNSYGIEPLIGSTSGDASQVVIINTAYGLVLGNDDNNNEKMTLWSTIDGGKRWSPNVLRIEP